MDFEAWFAKAGATECPCCHRQTTTVLNRRMNTKYVDEESNYLESCKDCFDESEAYWQERWDDYYGGCL